MLQDYIIKISCAIFAVKTNTKRTDFSWKSIQFRKLDIFEIVFMVIFILWCIGIFILYQQLELKIALVRPITTLSLVSSAYSSPLVETPFPNHGTYRAKRAGFRPTYSARRLAGLPDELVQGYV